MTSERSDKEVVILEDVNDCCTLNTDTFAGGNVFRDSIFGYLVTIVILIITM